MLNVDEDKAMWLRCAAAASRPLLFFLFFLRWLLLRTEVVVVGLQVSKAGAEAAVDGEVLLPREPRVPLADLMRAVCAWGTGARGNDMGGCGGCWCAGGVGVCGGCWCGGGDQARPIGETDGSEGKWVSVHSQLLA